MLAETLVGTGQASRITTLRLSFPQGSERTLELGWEGRERPGRHAETRRLSGRLRLAALFGDRKEAGGA